MTHDPLLIYTVLQGLLQKGEVVRVDLQAPFGRRDGVLEKITWSAIADPDKKLHKGYTLQYEPTYDTTDSGFFHRDELEHHSHLKQTDTGWLLIVNHIRP